MVACQGFANQIGIVERLMDLIDRGRYRISTIESIPRPWRPLEETHRR